MIAQTKSQIFNLLRQIEPELQRYGIKRYGVFGSFVRQQHTDSSDVDVLVEFEQGKKTFDRFMAVAFLLEDLFGRHVDLVTPESLSPYIAPHILGEVEYATISP